MSTVKVETYLRIRPLDAKHKLKQDYYSVSARGTPDEAKRQADISPSVRETQKQVLTVLGHPLAWAQPAATQQKLKNFHYIFDKVFSPELNNAQFHNECIGDLVERTLSEPDTSCIILGFGHHHSGKTHSLIGQNNYQLHKSITDVPLREAHDSRGSLLRTIHDIKQRDPGAKVTMNFLDLVIDNVRDLMRHVKKERIKSQSILAVNFAERIFGGNSTQSDGKPTSFNRMTDEEKQFQLQIIEKEYVKLEQVSNNAFKMRKLAKYEVGDDLSEASFFIDRCHEQSHKLNERVGYTNFIRHMQIINLKVKSSAGRKHSVIFVDLGDYEKLLSNIIDHQKVFEMMEYNSSVTTLANIFAGFKSGAYTVQNAPYEQSRLTQILQALLSKSKTKRLNIGFLACIWPTEALFPDVVHSLNYIDRFTKLNDPQNLYADEELYHAMNQRISELLVITRDNMLLKHDIDSFRSKHTAKLAVLKDKLGINVTVPQFETIIKSKPGSREYIAAKEHKEFVEKTEALAKNNRDIEDQIAQIKANMEDDLAAKRQIQEGFSQKLFTIQRRIESLREVLKISETELDNTVREQLQLKTDQLQKALDTTHGQILENTNLVEHIIKDSAQALSVLPVEPGRRNLLTKSVPEKDFKPSTTALAVAATKTLPQHVNLTKEESKRIAEENYERLLEKTQSELDSQLKAMTEQYEDVLRQKDAEIEKAAQSFKETHEKLKRDQNQARDEIVKVYHMAQHQDQILHNVESGFYSQCNRKLTFNHVDRPAVPNPADNEFLRNSIQKAKERAMSFAQATQLKQKKAQPTIPGLDLNNDSEDKQDKVSVIDEPFSKDPDTFVDPEALRAFVRDLMEEMKSNLSSSHPSILKGESVEAVVKETEKYKKACQDAGRKMDELRVQQEATKRMIERISTKGSLY